MADDRPIWVQAMLDKEIKPADFRLLSYLSWRQGENGSAWPSQLTIAHDLHLSQRAIRNSTRHLQNAGYLSVKKIDRQGRGHLLEYSIGSDIKGGTYIPPLGEEGGTQLPPLQGKRRKKTTTKGGTDSTTNTIQEHYEARAHKETFKKPSADEVKEYAESIGYDLDAEYFVDHYEARGWMLKNTPMKDWRAVVRTWQKRDEKAKPTAPVVKPVERGKDGLTPLERERRRIAQL